MFSVWVLVGEKVSSFTLIELVTVIALVSIFLFFLIKQNVTVGNETQQVKVAALLLALGFDEARGRAIEGNTYAKVFVDGSSDLKFRRVMVMKQTQNSWKAEREILLPERTFVLSLNDLSEYLGGGSLPYVYTEDQVIWQGEPIDGNCFIFNPEGYLSNVAPVVLGIGYGAKVGNDIKLKKDVNIRGLLITVTGKGIILESKNAIKEAI
ncbi:MAG: hypothetical protein LBF44_02600 [Holosporaceae bacterium]|jgi:hypothetical protein|nr:hypothetical protein [Holosporaceae bacterium]